MQDEFLRSLRVERCDDILRLGSDAEFSAPDAEAGGYVVAGLSALVAAPRTLVEGISDPRDGPYLSAVGMAAELEVDAGLLGVFEIVGLVVEQDGVLPPVDFCRESGHTAAALVGAVVASDDDEGAIDYGRFVAEQVDAGIPVELACEGFPGVVFVVAQAGIDGGLEAAELGCHVLVDEGTDADVDDVAGDEDEVGVLGVDEVDPPAEFGARIVVAEVQVAGHDNGVGMGQGLGGVESERHAHFVAVVQVAVEEDAGDEGDQDACRPPVVVQHGLGHEPAETSQVEQQEQHEGVEQDEERRRAHLVECACEGHGEGVEPAHEVEQQEGEAAGDGDDDEDFPKGGQGQQHPEVPTDVGQRGEGQQEKEYQPHGSEE